MPSVPGTFQFQGNMDILEGKKFHKQKVFIYWWCFLLESLSNRPLFLTKYRDTMSFYQVDVRTSGGDHLTGTLAADEA